MSPPEEIYKPESDFKWEGPQAFISPVRPKAKESVRPTGTVMPGFPPVKAEPSYKATRLEFYLALTGLGLVAFMFGHLMLLFTSVIGAETMNKLAHFLEDNCLLHAGAPPLILMILAHIVFAVRKVPNSARQQGALLRHFFSFRHFDTTMWGVQIVTGIFVLMGAAMHLWVVLVDLPIEAEKSGLRMFMNHLWLYIPLLLLTEIHASAGLWRIAIKWDILKRKTAHLVLTIWTAAFLLVGGLILYSLYQIGSTAAEVG